jgi:hypothetical protein
MKRKLLMTILTVALTLALIPAISAFADTDGDGLLGVFTEDQEQDMDEDADVEEVEDEDEEATDEEMPKLNLKSPVSQFGPGDVGETFVLTARIGDLTIDNLLISWVSSDESVATVAPDGTVTVMGPGRAEITAVMLDGSALAGKAKVFVLDNWPDKAKANKDEHGNNGQGHGPGEDPDDEDADEDTDEDESGEDSGDE